MPVHAGADNAYFVMTYAHPKLGKAQRRVFYRRLGPMSYANAVRCQARWEARSFEAKIVANRAVYWSEYHKNRSATDPQYVERKRTNAREWQRAKRKELTT